MWDPPRPGLEPVSPALAGRFSTTAPPGKPDSGVLARGSESMSFYSAILNQSLSPYFLMSLILWFKISFIWSVNLISKWVHESTLQFKGGWDASLWYFLSSLVRSRLYLSVVGWTFSPKKKHRKRLGYWTAKKMIHIHCPMWTYWVHDTCLERSA